MRLRAREYAVAGEVKLSWSDWYRLAADADLPNSMLVEVLQAWTTDTPEAKAFLRRAEEWTWDLGPAYSRERRAIILAGKAELEGAARQARSKRARAQNRMKGL
jgi:hypothetical protein